jgi:hypothetical protein
MLMTEERIALLATKKGGYKQKVIDAMQAATGKKNWKSYVLGKHIPDSVYTDLVEYMDKLENRKPSPKVTASRYNQETTDFISEYVENRKPFDDRSCGKHIYLMIHAKLVDWDVVQETLLRLEHEEFVQTNYWKYIAHYVKHTNGHKCNRCGSLKKLQVHHKTYFHKGREIYFMGQDLEVLCDHCHAKEHGKERKLLNTSRRVVD